MKSRCTISNVAPPKLKKSVAKRLQDDVEDEVASQTATLDFQKMAQDESGIPNKRKAIDPVEKILLENITNRASRKSAASLNQWQQWGLWLGKEIEEFRDPVGTIEIQAYITQYIASKKRGQK
ncbi:uncharacterized protein LOC117176701 [Belonocnema kinseyi]|uniref:uncharacterized protein LOC117176701 n=1 Tax=Belonocnema kinseyi TaxID=2817044 RepID=UPI00143D747C|nr:uncharacterized protein LOC117176701 [Belonocnema kinseyi]